MNRDSLHKMIEEALRNERPSFKPSAGFADRVIDALPSGPLKSQRPVAEARPTGPRLLLVGALAAVALIVWATFLPQPQPDSPSLASTGATEANVNFDLPKIDVAQVQELTVKINEPLEREFERVLADTRTAIQFVAANVTP